MNTIKKLVIYSLALASPMVYADSLQVMVTDDSGAALANVVVYAVPQESIPPAALARVEVEQKNKEFQPFVSVIPRGTTTYFPNHDGIGHHVYSFSAAKTFELPLSEKEITVPIVFDQTGVVTVGCNIHDWMVAYINVVDTPYYSLTDAGGQAMIIAIPPGDYTLLIWHPGMASDKAIEKPVSLGSAGANQYAFSLSIRPEYFWKPVHPPENEEELY